VLDLLEVKCYHTILKLFCGLLFAFCCNSTFSNVKMNENSNSALTASDLQNGGKFQKVGGEFPGRCVLGLLEEKCCHTIFKLFRGLLFASCCNGTFSNVKMNVNMNVKPT